MRATGAVIGASFGLVLLGAGVLFGSPASMEATIGYGLPALVLGGVLGWITFVVAGVWVGLLRLAIGRLLASRA